MIEEHPSELRADIARYFPGRSLNEFHRLSEDGTQGSMSWLELWEFYRALPYESMTRAVQAGDHGLRRWDEPTYLLRDIHALLQLQMRVAWVGGQLQGKPPEVNLWAAPDLRSLEEIEAERTEALDRAERARRWRDATKPGATNSEYAKKLAAARDLHLQIEAERARAQAETRTGEQQEPADN